MPTLPSDTGDGRHADPSRPSSRDDGPADTPVGKLADNIVYFGRALRRAGLPVGPGHTADAVRAVSVAGFHSRDDFFWTLHACFVSRAEHRQVFAQAFRLFWRDPKFLERMMALLSPMTRTPADERRSDPGERRAAGALLDRQDPVEAQGTGEEEIELSVDASATASYRERLRTLDFAQMSADEMAQAKRAIAQLTLPIEPPPSRRRSASPTGRFLDRRRTLRRLTRLGGEITDLPRQTASPRRPVLIALCDVSGSMSAYSRMLLAFLHAVSARADGDWSRCHAFTFGTRLTNITRQLRISDVDAALAASGAETDDWEGGTRIGDCLRSFNREWSRRLTGSGAYLLLVTDGLEGGCIDHLSREIKHLQRAVRRLVWINPLLRWDGFAPRARGVATLLPHVDCLRSGHNITSLEGLAQAISTTGGDGEKCRLLRSLTSGSAP